MTNVSASRYEPFGPALAEAQFEAILERVLRAYHRDEGHGGANRIGESILDGDLVPVAREAFLDADDMPPDHDVLQVLDREEMQLLGEGYHVMTLVEPANRFVRRRRTGKIYRCCAVRGVATREDWAHDHGVQPEATSTPDLAAHPLIRRMDRWHAQPPTRRQRGAGLNDERRALERPGRSASRSLGTGPRTLRVHYPTTEREAGAERRPRFPVVQP
jgi:hypothetical protein